MLIKIGSRASILSQIQTISVGRALSKKFPNLKIQYEFKDSQGDKDLETPLWQISGQGIFTKDLQDDLLDGKIDAIIHSWKDLDLKDRPETTVFSVLPREDQRDVIFYKRRHLTSIPGELVFLTSSPRRSYNLTNFVRDFFPNSLASLPLSFDSVRGNIQTRFKKFIESKASGLIVAKAAIDRIMLSESLDGEISELLGNREMIRSWINECVFMVTPLSQNPCAPAQGAICVEIRKSDLDIQSYFSELTDSETEYSAIKERMILRKYGGGCHQKIGVSVLNPNFGELIYIKGETEDGALLDEMIVNHVVTEKYQKTEVWPPNAKKATKQREPIAITIPEKDLYVTKGYAVPENANLNPNRNLLWTSGTVTWKELAIRGIWVHGTSDGLGEGEMLRLSGILPRKINLLKLSHDDKQDRIHPVLKTYHLSAPEIPENFDPKKIKAAFWNSGSEFSILLNRFPEWKDIHHYSGSGSTFLKIRQTLGASAKITVLPTFQYWQKHYIINNQ